MSWLSSSRCGCVMRPSKKRPHLRVSSVGGVAEHIPLKDESCSHAWLSTVSITFMIYWLERWISVAFSNLAAASSFEARFADGQTESRGYVSSLLLGRWPVPLAGGQEHSGKTFAAAGFIEQGLEGRGENRYETTIRPQTSRSEENRRGSSLPRPQSRAPRVAPCEYDLTRTALASER